MSSLSNNGELERAGWRSGTSHRSARRLFRLGIRLLACLAFLCCLAAQRGECARGGIVETPSTLTTPRSPPGQREGLQKLGAETDATAPTASQCVPGVEGWDVVRNAALHNVGYHAAAIPVGRHFLVMGGVTDVESSTDLYNYVLHHTQRGINLFDPKTGRVEVPEEIQPNYSSADCPLSLSTTGPLGKRISPTPSTGAFEMKAKDHHLRRCIEAQRENSTTAAVLPLPVVGSGSVVRVQNRVYALGACNMIPDEVGLDLLRMTDHVADTDRSANPATPTKRSTSPEVRLVENYLRSVTRIQFYQSTNAAADARVLHQHVFYQPPSMTLRFNATCVAGARGAVYIVGGVNARTGEGIATAALFDTESGAFVEGVWSLDAPVVSPAATSSDSLLFFAGGFSMKDDPALLSPSRRRRDYHTNVGIVDTKHGVLDSSVARYASHAFADELQWTAPQLFVRGSALFMMSAGGKRSYGGVAYWANMSVPPASKSSLYPVEAADEAGGPRGRPLALRAASFSTKTTADLVADGTDAGTQTDGAAHKNRAPTSRSKGFFSFVNLSLVPARCDAVVAMWPSDDSASASFFLFGGRRSPLGHSDRGATPEKDIFRAALFSCPDRDARDDAARKTVDFLVAPTVLPKMLGFAYTRVMNTDQHARAVTSSPSRDLGTVPPERTCATDNAATTRDFAAAAPAIPNNHGRNCVSVNSYAPLWYNVSFSVLLSYAETAQACPEIVQSSGASPPSYSSCSLMLSSSPQCNEPIVEFHHLSPLNARVMHVPAYNQNGSMKGTQKAFAVAQTVFKGSLERGLMHVSAMGVEGRSASSSSGSIPLKAMTDTPARAPASPATARSCISSHCRGRYEEAKKSNLLFYEQSFVYVCFSRRPEVVANCGTSHQRSRAARQSQSSRHFEDLLSTNNSGVSHVETGLHRGAECSTLFYETLSPHQPFILSPEIPCSNESNSSGGRGDSEPPIPTPNPSPSRLLRSWMLLTVLSVLLVTIAVYRLVTPVLTPGSALSRSWRRNGAGRDFTEEGGPDADQQRSLLPYGEARSFLEVGGMEGGGGGGFRGHTGAYGFGYDDFLDEYETALDAAGVAGGLTSLEATWDTAGTTRRQRLLDGKYEVLRNLGKGSFSVVYLVRRTTDNTTYALKYLQCNNDLDRHEAMKECEVVYALQGHPNVIQLFDMFMSYRFDRHMVTVPRSRKSCGAAHAANAAAACENTRQKPEGGGKQQDQEEEEDGNRTRLAEDAERVLAVLSSGAEAHPVHSGGSSHRLHPPPPTNPSTFSTTRKDAPQQEGLAEAVREPTARADSTAANSTTMLTGDGRVNAENHSAVTDGRELAGRDYTSGQDVTASKQQPPLAASSSNVTYAGAPVAPRPIIHMDSTYLDAMAAGVLLDNGAESPGTPPQQAEDAQADHAATSPHHRHKRGLPSLQAERYLSLVMAYHERGDLARWVRQRRALQPLIPEATIVSIAFQVLSLLAYMHHRHRPPIVHRDLKPENILLTTHVHYENVNEEFLPIVVTDFGLSRIMDKTFCETGVGSLPYVAPECWQRRYSTKVDIWALGCVLYAVCSKRVDSNNVKVMFSECTNPGFHARLRYELESIYGYSDALAWFITALLVVKPDDRPTAAEALCMLRRHPTNDLGEPLFRCPPLSTLLRATTPQQHQEEHDTGYGGGESSDDAA
ncbi:putative protein kinase [Leptomonas seymouri]|uniref:non-specific serine/threonine protein kinase n=1 Tax=Leptomonas seymouri TaxID=5684 RepID=A0A0N1I294_LEPSE|nr:putative protein kinase [Leptomonas seymouri]|eukprot:KPI90623.1 putative protein kinase [Leptomonas seymouri]